jgi:endonuclease/exonuclease/phosphatase family metal-dependent hydrolase
MTQQDGAVQELPLIVPSKFRKTHEAASTRDHFFVEASAKASVRKCEVHTTAETRRWSDHSPLVLELG